MEKATDNKPPEKEEKKKLEAKPLPVDKEKAREIETQLKDSDKSQKSSEDSKSGETPSKKESKEKKEKPLEKKSEAVARGVALPISKKHSMYICRFIKNKKIDQAISLLEQVGKFKLPIKYKGEIPHRKGSLASGRYPIKASKYFINLLKGLKGNAVTNGLELDETRIYIASATWASRPMRRGGRLAKRTNVLLKAKEFKGDIK